MLRFIYRITGSREFPGFGDVVPFWDHRRRHHHQKHKQITTTTPNTLDLAILILKEHPSTSPSQQWTSPWVPLPNCPLTPDIIHLICTLLSDELHTLYNLSLSSRLY